MSLFIITTKAYKGNNNPPFSIHCHGNIKLMTDGNFGHVVTHKEKKKLLLTIYKKEDDTPRLLNQLHCNINNKAELLCKVMRGINLSPAAMERFRDSSDAQHNRIDQDNTKVAVSSVYFIRQGKTDESSRSITSQR